MPKIIMNGNGQVSEITDKIKAVILNSGGKCKVLDEVAHKYSAYEVHTMLFEKYYGRSSNLVNLTVMVSGANDMVVVDAFATEVSGGMLSRFSWGMEEDYIYVLTTLLNSLNFQAE